jgi:hypothetical protein
VSALGRRTFSAGSWALACSYAAGFTVSIRWLSAEHVEHQRGFTYLQLATITTGVGLLAVRSVSALARGTSLPVATEESWAAGATGSSTGSTRLKTRSLAGLPRRQRTHRAARRRLPRRTARVSSATAVHAGQRRTHLARGVGDVLEERRRSVSSESVARPAAALDPAVGQCGREGVLRIPSGAVPWHKQVRRHSGECFYGGGDARREVGAI